MAGGLRVLVVDDHPVNRRVLSEVLTHLGCEVAVAEDGAQALAAVADEPFDLVCLDRHMPGLSGDAVAARLPPGQFVLAWSTDTADLPARFDGVLAKPVTIAAAREAMAQAEARRRAARPSRPAARPLPEGPFA